MSCNLFEIVSSNFHMTFQDANSAGGGKKGMMVFIRFSDSLTVLELQFMCKVCLEISVLEKGQTNQQKE
uniref:RRM domain-containing protein n=1 Tax=Arion vulgaris TaxID=1028688 RepID=A0A0B6Z575_9EUPU